MSYAVRAGPSELRELVPMLSSPEPGAPVGFGASPKLKAAERMAIALDISLPAHVAALNGDAVGVADLEWFAGLYDSHAVRVFSLAMRIVRDVGAAEDVVQDVFLQAWTQRSRYDQARGPLAAWLLMLTRSRAIDRIRAARRDGGQSISFDAAVVAAPSTSDDDDTRVIREAVVMLPTEHRQPLELAFYEGYTHSEIATLLKQPLGTVKTRIRRAISLLRTTIQ